jgi:RNA polymerase sigma factor (TIGR02999 family)
VSDVTRLLSSIDQGDPHAAEQLLPLVYGELRKLAARKLGREKADHTLQATALVHEVYLRLVDVEKVQSWNSRGHFFAAAAEAMRRILVEHARKKQSLKRGGDRTHYPLHEAKVLAPEAATDVLAVNEALDRLAARDPEAAELVKLRFFAGFSTRQAAEALHISARTAERAWNYSRAFLLKELKGNHD